MPDIPTLDNSGFLATMLPVQPSLGAGDEPPGVPPSGAEAYEYFRLDGTSNYVRPGGGIYIRPLYQYFRPGGVDVYHRAGTTDEVFLRKN